MAVTESEEGEEYLGLTHIRFGIGLLVDRRGRAIGRCYVGRHNHYDLYLVLSFKNAIRVKGINRHGAQART